MVAKWVFGLAGLMAGLMAAWRVEQSASSMVDPKADQWVEH